MQPARMPSYLVNVLTRLKCPLLNRAFIPQIAEFAETICATRQTSDLLQHKKVGGRSQLQLVRTCE